MVLIEPVSFHLLKDREDHKAWQIADRVASGCIRHADNGRNKKAADVYMGFWLGALRWRFAPRRFKAAVMRTIPKVADEFRSIYASPANPEEFRDIQAPVTLVRGTRTRLPASAVVDVLAGLLPTVSVAEVRGAGLARPLPFALRRDPPLHRIGDAKRRRARPPWVARQIRPSTKRVI